MTIGERIKYVRELKGISQEQLAKQMGYSGKTSISKIESAGDSLTTKTITRFANALGCTESQLMGWHEIEWNPYTQEIVVPPNAASSSSFEKTGMLEKHTVGNGKQDHYIDERTSAMADEISQNKELRLLFETARNSSEEDIKTIHQMLLALKKKEQHNDD